MTEKNGWDGKNAPAVDQDAFLFGFNSGMAAAAGLNPECDPSSMQFRIGDDKYAFTNSPMNRLMLSMRDAFSGGPEEAVMSALTRTFAALHAIDQYDLADYVVRTDSESLIHEALIRAFAVSPMDGAFQFDHSALMQSANTLRETVNG